MAFRFPNAPKNMEDMARSWDELVRTLELRDKRIPYVPANKQPYVVSGTVSASYNLNTAAPDLTQTTQVLARLLTDLQSNGTIQ